MSTKLNIYIKIYIIMYAYLSLMGVSETEL